MIVDLKKPEPQEPIPHTHFCKEFLGDKPARCRSAMASRQIDYRQFVKEEKGKSITDEAIRNAKREAKLRV
jgi:hypothetical protein